MYSYSVTNKQTKMNNSNADLATNKLQALKSQVKYIDTIPFSELESWEVKEYQQIRANISNEIAELEAHISQYPQLFN